MHPNPHDALFKKVFSEPANAEGELRYVLPRQLAEALDFSTLRLAPASFVDEALRERHSDLLYEVELRGHPAFVHVLFEHKSQPERFVALTLLDYMVRIWQAWRVAHPDARALPAIVPVVIYHGEARWSVSRRFHDLVHGLAEMPPELRSTLRELVPGFRYALDRVSEQSDEALRSRAMTEMARLALLLFKHARTTEDLAARFETWLRAWWRIWDADTGTRAIEVFCKYIYLVSPHAAPEAIVEVVGRVAGEQAKEVAMTGAEILMQRGEARGEANARRTLVSMLLEEKFGPLSADHHKRLEKAERAELDHWAKRLLFADSLDAVFEP